MKEKRSPEYRLIVGGSEEEGVAEGRGEGGGRTGGYSADSDL